MNNKSNKSTNLYDFVISRYLPFWPLFIGMVGVFMLLAWTYIKFSTPVFETTATIMINDEKKGVDDARLLESMNAFDSKKIIENEIEVMQSRKLMQNVVDSLQLYASFYEEKKIKDVVAYTTSPISLKLKDPKQIPVLLDEAAEKFHFTFNEEAGEVVIQKKPYQLNEWIEFKDFGLVKFSLNPNKNSYSNNSFYFTINNSRETTQYLLESLEVTASNKLSSVINLSYKDPSQLRGENILNNLIKAYNQSIINNRNFLASNTLTFIEERMSNVEEELTQLETQIQRYKSDEGAVDLSEQGRMYLQNVGENDREISDLQMQLSVLNQVENYVISKNTTAGIVPSTLGVKDPILTQLLERLYDAELKYERLKRTTAENNPILSTLQGEIQNIRPSILENIRNQKQNLQASLSNMNSSRGRYNSIINTIPVKERELIEINRRKAIQDNLFNYLLQKREETALSYAPTQEDNRIIDPAQASLLPVKPKKSLIYLVSIAFAIGLSIGYVTIKENLNRTILFRSQIESQTDIPLIGELPFVKTVTSHPFVSKDDSMIFIDEIRQVAARLGLFSRFFKKKKILITSNIAGEGKSFISANLAKCLAEAGKRTLLIDIDLRNPKLTDYFGMVENEGLVDYLNNEINLEQILQDTHYKDLFFIPSGTKGGDYTELLLNGRLEHLFRQAEIDFDYIIIDSAPISMVSDVNLLAEYSEKNLIITRHNYTPKDIIMRLDDSVKLKSLENVSLVFNSVKNRGFVKSEFNYGYGYANSYAYNSKVTK